MKKAVLVAWIAGAAAMTACAPSHTPSADNTEPAKVAAKLSAEQQMQNNLENGPWYSECTNGWGTLIQPVIMGESRRTKIVFGKQSALISAVTYNGSDCTGSAQNDGESFVWAYELIPTYNAHGDVPQYKIQFYDAEWVWQEDIGMILRRTNREGIYQLSVDGDNFSLVSIGRNHPLDRFVNRVISDVPRALKRDTKYFYVQKIFNVGVYSREKRDDLDAQTGK